MIEAVAQAIPTYSMSCFKILDSLCEELTSLMRNFWWGQKNDERKMVWISWDKLCTPKSQGGVGFKQLKQFNLALLAKQGWRLQVCSDSFMFRVFKARYFPNCDFIHAKVGCNPSFAWCSIMAAQSIVSNGVHWQVGNGRSIRIWQDRWLPTPSTYKVISHPLLGAEA